MNNYTGKTVYVGLDVHKKTYAITCICEKEVIKRDTIKAIPDNLVSYLCKYFHNAIIKTAYEAGFSGFVLHRYLLSNGIENIVIHPASVEISARNRVKTDKRDSLKIAMQLSDGHLKGIHIPSIQREGYREVTRLREKISRDKRRVGNRIKGLLYRQGLIGPDDDATVSLKWLKRISSYKYEESVKYMLDVCTAEWLFLREKIKQIDVELATQAIKDKELEKVYRSFPGIGIVHARVLANELEDMKYFSNEKQLFSFTGLTPTEHSSGENRRLGHISHQGRSILRKTLVQAAWVAISQDESLQVTYARIAARSGKKRAIVAVARRLIGQIRSCFMNNTEYQKRRVEKIYETHTKAREVSLAVSF